jgi:hypothetical protein
MVDMGNPEMESAARRIFRQALHLHYIEGLECGDAVQQWLRTEGGWFRDNQEMYEADVRDDPEDIMSNDPFRAMSQARDLMLRLYYTLRIEIDEAYLHRVIEARNGADITNYGGTSPHETALVGLVLNWLVSMGMAPPSPVDDTPEEPEEDLPQPLEPHLDSTSTVGMLASSDGSRSRSRSRDASPSLETAFHRRVAQTLMDNERNMRQIYVDHARALRQIDMDREREIDERIRVQVEERMNTLMNLVREDTSEWPILVGPGLLNGQQNRLEMVTEHQFTGTVLSGLFSPQNMIERVTEHQQHSFPETAHRLQ